MFGTGYIGADCSIDETQPPVLTGMVRSGICDIQQRPCATVSVFGYGFVSSKTLRCRFSVCCKLLISHLFATYQLFPFERSSSSRRLLQVPYPKMTERSKIFLEDDFYFSIVLLAEVDIS